MGIDPAGILAGIAVGGAVGTAMAGAWRNRALSLWKEQAEALGAQNALLKQKVDELTVTVAHMEGELRHLRAQPDFTTLVAMQTQTLDILGTLARKMSDGSS